MDASENDLSFLSQSGLLGFDGVLEDTLRGTTTSTYLDRIGTSPTVVEHENGWLMPQPPCANRAAASIISLMLEDHTLIELPNHLLALKNSTVGAKIDKEDILIVQKGWIYIQRMTSTFAGIFLPNEKHFEQAVEFLRRFLQEAASEYMIRVEKALSMYIEESFVRPVATTEHELLSYNERIDNLAKVCMRVRVSMTRSKDSVLWNNWFHFYQLVKGLWLDEPGNTLSPRNFAYEYLKSKRIKLPTNSRTVTDPMDKDFLDQILPGRRTDPYGSPFQQYLSMWRHKRLYKRLTENAGKVSNLLFMVDSPRGKDLRKTVPYHTWNMAKGKGLFYLYDRIVSNDKTTVVGQRKRDRAPDEMSGGNNLEDQMRTVTGALVGDHDLDTMFQMMENFHGRNAYYDYIRRKGPRDSLENKILQLSNERQNDNLNVYPAEEIRIMDDEQLTNDPSTLTGSEEWETNAARAGLEGILAMANGRADNNNDINHFMTLGGRNGEETDVKENRPVPDTNNVDNLAKFTFNTQEVNGSQASHDTKNGKTENATYAVTYVF